MRTGGLRTCRLLFFVLLFWGGPLSVPAAEITDMAGRTVLLPDREPRIFCASPPSLYLLYSLDPSLAAGLNFPLNEREKKYLRPDFARLSVLGGWFGQGRMPNLETLLTVRPDFILVWYLARRIKDFGAEATYLTDEVKFPGVICVSTNEQLVHSFPTEYVFEKGDVVSFDLVIGYRGMKTDSAFTMVIDEEPRGAKKQGILDSFLKYLSVGACSFS